LKLYVHPEAYEAIQKAWNLSDAFMEAHFAKTELLPAAPSEPKDGA
jgi:hypothetical protein